MIYLAIIVILFFFEFRSIPFHACNCNIGALDDVWMAYCLSMDPIELIIFCHLLPYTFLFMALLMSVPELLAASLFCRKKQLSISKREFLWSLIQKKFNKDNFNMGSEH